MDILIDIVAGMVIAIGIYNLPCMPISRWRDFPEWRSFVSCFGIPVGAGTILLNVPVAIFCYKYLGRIFFLKSAKSMIISSLLMDYVAAASSGL